MTGDDRVYYIENMFGGRPNGYGLCIKKINQKTVERLGLNPAAEYKLEYVGNFRDGQYDG